MPIFTITAKASAPVNGSGASMSQSFTVECDDLVEFTKDVTPSVDTCYASGNWLFLLVINDGDADMFVEANTSGDYHALPLPQGAHLFLTSTYLDGTDAALFNGANLYTASGTTKARVIIGVKNS